MKYTEEQINKLSEDELKKLIEKEENSKLSDAAKTIIEKNKVSDEDKESIKRIRK